MPAAFSVTAPFFEIGPKAYLYGDAVVALAQAADALAAEYRVQVFFTPQAVDLYRVAHATQNICVFAQHMDALPVGRGIGATLPEAVAAAGAKGVLLNHAEKPLPLALIDLTMQRAREVGLATMVCAGNLEETRQIAALAPQVLLAEAPELIGTGKREDDDAQAIRRINEEVRRIAPQVKVLHGAGITDEQDVYRIMLAGAEGTGSTSGILKAADPYRMMEKMIRAVRQGWDETHA